MKQTPSPAPAPATGRLNWLWGALGAVLLAAAVGVGVYFVMDGAHQRSIDDKVNQRVEELAAAQQEGPQGPPPATVRVAQARTQMAQQRVSVVGRLMEVRRATIASEVEGRVLELLTPAGREVVGGQTVIARVDSVWSKLAVEQARADIAAAEARARESKQEYGQRLALFERGSGDQQAVNDARAVAEADAASVLSFKAALNRAEETNKRVEIIAPFDGTVTEKLTEQGQWLEPGSAVVEIVSRGLIDAVIDVPEAFITQVPKGTPIEVRIDALNQTISGEVVAVNPDGSNPARTFPVKVRIDDQDGLLKVGMSVTARVPLQSEQEVLVVPRDAVQYADGGAQVWMAIVTPDSEPGTMPQAVPMDVEVLFGFDELFAVKPLPKQPGMTLEPGMQVVTEGAERILFPSQMLMVMPAGAPDPPEQATNAGGGP